MMKTEKCKPSSCDEITCLNRGQVGFDNGSVNDKRPHDVTFEGDRVNFDRMAVMAKFENESGEVALEEHRIGMRIKS